LMAHSGPGGEASWSGDACWSGDAAARVSLLIEHLRDWSEWSVW
jgi:hypothetical protein